MGTVLELTDLEGLCDPGEIVELEDEERYVFLERDETPEFDTALLSWRSVDHRDLSVEVEAGSEGTTLWSVGVDGWLVVEGASDTVEIEDDDLRSEVEWAFDVVKEAAPRRGEPPAAEDTGQHAIDVLSLVESASGWMSPAEEADNLDAPAPARQEPASVPAAWRPSTIPAPPSVWVVGWDPGACEEVPPKSIQLLREALADAKESRDNEPACRDIIDQALRLRCYELALSGVKATRPAADSTAAIRRLFRDSGNWRFIDIAFARWVMKRLRSLPRQSGSDWDGAVAWVGAFFLLAGHPEEAAQVWELPANPESVEEEIVSACRDYLDAAGDADYPLELASRLTSKSRRAQVKSHAAGTLTELDGDSEKTWRVPKETGSLVMSSKWAGRLAHGDLKRLVRREDTDLVITDVAGLELVVMQDFSITAHTQDGNDLEWTFRVSRSKHREWPILLSRQSGDDGTWVQQRIHGPAEPAPDFNGRYHWLFWDVVYSSSTYVPGAAVKWFAYRG